jgi:hypothetical protein
VCYCYWRILTQINDFMTVMKGRYRATTSRKNDGSVVKTMSISQWIAHLICCGDRFESLEVVVFMSVTL